MRMAHASLTLTVAAVWLLLTPSVPVRACNLPTFRYALERWQPYAYEALVYYDRSLPAALQSAVEDLQKHPLNLVVWLVDVNRDDMHEELKKVWDREKDNASLPWVVIRYPYPAWKELGRDTVWSGNLDEDTVRRVVESPLRRQIAEHILSGVSIVWLFVDGADSAVNEAKLKLLRDRLAWVESEAFLPEAAHAEASRGDMGERSPGFVPLKIAFEILRVRRDDPQERHLLAMLLNTLRDAGKRAHEPALFPMYGQGRIYPGMLGEAISERAIEDACFTLLGTPNNFVHEGTQGPGTDLLVQADWFGGVSNILSVSSEAPTLTGLAMPEPEADADDTDAEPRAAAPGGLAPGRSAAATLGILLVAIALISVKALQRKER